MNVRIYSTFFYWANEYSKIFKMIEICKMNVRIYFKNFTHRKLGPHSKFQNLPGEKEEA